MNIRFSKGGEDISKDKEEYKKGTRKFNEEEVL